MTSEAGTPPRKTERAASKAPNGSLVVEWPDGGRLEYPLPLPAGTTPCEYVAMIGDVVSEDRRHTTWWIEP